MTITMFAAVPAPVPSSVARRSDDRIVQPIPNTDCQGTSNSQPIESCCAPPEQNTSKGAVSRPRTKHSLARGTKRHRAAQQNESKDVAELDLRLLESQASRDLKKLLPLPYLPVDSSLKANFFASHIPASTSKNHVEDRATARTVNTQPPLELPRRVNKPSPTSSQNTTFDKSQQTPRPLPSVSGGEASSPSPVVKRKCYGPVESSALYVAAYTTPHA